MQEQQQQQQPQEIPMDGTGRGRVPESTLASTRLHTSVHKHSTNTWGKYILSLSLILEKGISSGLMQMKQWVPHKQNKQSFRSWAGMTVGPQPEDELCSVKDQQKQHVVSRMAAHCELNGVNHVTLGGRQG